MTALRSAASFPATLRPEFKAGGAFYIKDTLPQSRSWKQQRGQSRNKAAAEKNDSGDGARRASRSEALAEALNIRQATISKMEHRSDMYLSTLRKLIEAMGGELQIIARMPNGLVQSNQFRKVRQGAKAAKN